MFDIIQPVRHEKGYVPYEKTVRHEGFSPDKAADLLLTFKEKAERNVVDAFCAKSNDFRGTVVLSVDPASDTRTMRVAFSLNGKPYHFSEPVAWMRMSRQEAANALVEKMSVCLARELLTACAKELI